MTYENYTALPVESYPHLGLARTSAGLALYVNSAAVPFPNVDALRSYFHVENRVMEREAILLPDLPPWLWRRVRAELLAGINSAGAIR